MNLFHIAEKLGMTVGRLKEELTLEEYFGWLKFYQMRYEQQSKKPGNIMDMSDGDSIARSFGV